ncbi:MAG: hypothetical protein E7510_09440 [Ruminococcus sp.]|nr:hypothetical protein [Ruminococcus sp.]
MAQKIAIGSQSFSSIIENNCFFIDKTSLIKDWWENYDSVTLITRPRRFGKTLNMDMINCFFSNKYEGRSDLFENLEIWKDEKYREMQGKYPVIFFSFAGIKEKTYESAVYRMCNKIRELYVSNSFLLESPALLKSEKKNFEEYLEKIDERDLPDAINRLCYFLSGHYKKNKVIVLLDEYDTPLQEAYINGYWDEMSGLIRSLFNNTFKTNIYLDRAILTGITRVSKESMFSDLNNLKVASVSSNIYSKYFGFTEDEVFEAMDKFGYTNKDEVKSWYDGFTIGNEKDIYNPWSIINFLDEGVLKPYWSNTSSNGLAGKLIMQGDEEVKSDFEDLLNGKTIKKKLDEDIVFSQLDEDMNAVWSLLSASGYLKIKSRDFDIYELEIVNYEVMQMFNNMVNRWFTSKPVKYNKLIKTLLNGEIEDLNEYMNDLTISIISSFDTGKDTNEKQLPERFYHGFVLGLLVELRDRYVLQSNRESGAGRYDIMLIPKNIKEDNALIIEFKVIRRNRGEKGLEDTLKNALEQIEQKQYSRFLTDLGVPKEHILKYGFAFEGKEVLVGLKTTSNE